MSDYSDLPSEPLSGTTKQVEPSYSASQPWSDTTKRMVMVGGLLVVALVLYYFRPLLTPLVMAILVAYILNPLVGLVTAYTGLSRTLTVALIYLLVLVLLIISLSLLVPSLVRQAIAIDINLQQIGEDLTAFLDRPLTFMGYSLELSQVWDEVQGQLRDLLSPLFSTVSTLLNVVTSLVWLVFILVISFYILKDQPRIALYVYQLTPPRYQSDVLLLNKEINAIWSAFLRGQLILSVVVGLMVGTTMATVGLRNAVALGALAGALEVIPNIGPVIAAAPAVLIAFFQGSTYLPLSPLWFALLVAGLYTLIQQIENNYLVPRILGSRLHLHPLAIIVAIVAGANLAGVLGALLAAPTLATMRVFASYVYRKLLDEHPFPLSDGQPMAPETDEAPGGEESQAL